MFQIDDAGNSFAATGLCFEVAESLVKFQKYSEAATYFQVCTCEYNNFFQADCPYQALLIFRKQRN